MKKINHTTQKQNELFNTIKSISFSRAEKDSIKESIFSSIALSDTNTEKKKSDSAPSHNHILVRNSTDIRHTYGGLIPTFSELNPHLSRGARKLTVTTMLVAMIVGSVSAAMADTSLPGDFLYPMKLGVNEKFGSFSARTSEGRAKYEATLAVRRLEEVETLAMLGTLTASTTIEAGQQFDTHISQLNTFLKTMSHEGKVAEAGQITNDLTADLRVRQIAIRMASTSKKSTGIAMITATTSVGVPSTELALKGGTRVNVGSTMEADDTTSIKLQELAERIGFLITSNTVDSNVLKIKKAKNHSVLRTNNYIAKSPKTVTSSSTAHIPLGDNNSKNASTSNSGIIETTHKNNQTASSSSNAVFYEPKTTNGNAVISIPDIKDSATIPRVPQVLP